MIEMLCILLYSKYYILFKKKINFPFSLFKKIFLVMQRLGIEVNSLDPDLNLGTI